MHLIFNISLADKFLQSLYFDCKLISYQRRIILRPHILFAFILCAVSAFCFNTNQSSEPPFPSITISGELNDKYDRVSLFTDGSAGAPLKTEYVKSSGRYSITIYLPEDLKENDNYYSIDMRFWKDKNDNGERDSTDSYSQCHFIIWDPQSGKVFLKVYKGQRYEITSSDFEYDYI
jgi:hypothetical protein